jgi:hypothetical protein
MHFLIMLQHYQCVLSETHWCVRFNQGHRIPKTVFKKNMTGLRVFGSDASHVQHLLYGNLNNLNIKFLK